MDITFFPGAGHGVDPERNPRACPELAEGNLARTATTLDLTDPFRKIAAFIAAAAFQ